MCIRDRYNRRLGLWQLIYDIRYMIYDMIDIIGYIYIYIHGWVILHNIIYQFFKLDAHIFYKIMFFNRNINFQRFSSSPLDSSWKTALWDLSRGPEALILMLLWYFLVLKIRLSNTLQKTQPRMYSFLYINLIPMYMYI